jgi:ABC-type transport system substrate-binding protein
MLRRLRRACLLCLVFLSGTLHAADPNKVLNWAFEIAETGFDPAQVSDTYSNTVIEAVFESLLTYDYLARPPKLVGGAAEALPEITDDGKTYTLKIRRGVYFSPDPVFKGKKRELTAEDFVYSFKRFADPKTRAPYEFLLDDVVGFKEVADKAKVAGKLDYSTPIPGLDAVDRYTLRIRLKQVNYNFAYHLAMSVMCAVAREAVEGYGDDINAHPVGTGPYMLTKYLRSSKITLEANPNYRGLTWDFKPGEDPYDKTIVADMQGKKMPQIARVEISIIEEGQAELLAFRQGQLDVLRLTNSFAPTVLPGDKVAPDLAEKGVRLDRITEAEATYTLFNMKDPVIGGFSKDKIALRRAIVMAYNNEEEIRVIRKGQAVALQMPMSPNVVGFNPNYRSSITYDPVAANRLLDKFGYKKGADGYRNNPDGSRLEIVHSSTPASIEREYDELWKKAFDSIGIRSQFYKAKWPELNKDAKSCKVMSWGVSWLADYPDADTFVQLLYGPNIGQSNNACYENPNFDRMYEKAKSLPDSPERNKLYVQMSRQFEFDTPWKLGIARYRNTLVQGWVKGFRKHPFLHAEWLYIDIDPKKGEQ